MDNSKIAGIYCIASLINGKKYFGQSVDIGKRWKQHLNKLKLNKHENQHLQNHYNKYLVEDLIFTIVETVDIEGMSKKQINQTLCDKEQPYLLYKNLFNICTKSGSCLGVKRDEKHIKLMRDINRKSGRGISYKKGMYYVTISYKGKSYYIGYYTTEEEALSVRIKAEAEIWTEAFDSLSSTEQLNIINKFTKTNRKSGLGVSKAKHNTCLGVSKTKHNTWEAQIDAYNCRINLGTHPTYEQALEARLEAERVFWTEEFEQLTSLEKEAKIKEYRSKLGLIKTKGASYTGELYIKFRNNRYQFNYRKTGKYKNFLTLEEAIEFRDEYLGGMLFN